MDIFGLRDQLIGDYASYTRIFITIADKHFYEKVDNALDLGAFWSEPLFQHTLSRGIIMTKIKADMTLKKRLEYLRIPKSTLYKLTQNLRLPRQINCQQWYFNKEAIDRWLHEYSSKRALQPGRTTGKAQRQMKNGGN